MLYATAAIDATIFFLTESEVYNLLAPYNPNRSHERRNSKHSYLRASGAPILALVGHWSLTRNT